MKLSPSFTLLAFIVTVSLFLCPAYSKERNLSEKELAIIKATKVLKIDVRTSRWRKPVKPFDIESYVKTKLTDKCLIFTDQANQSYDAVIDIVYREKKGEQWSFGTATGHSTITECTIQLSHKSLGRLFKKIISTVPNFFSYMAPSDIKDVDEYCYRAGSVYFQKNPIIMYIDEVVEHLIAGNNYHFAIARALETSHNHDTMMMAAEILGESGDKEMAIPLLSALNSKYMDNYGREAVQKALLRIGWKPKDEYETVYFHIGTYHLGVESKTAIGRLGGKAVSQLLRVLDDQEAAWIMRGNAAVALGDLKASDAVEALIANLKDKDDAVRSHCIEALGVIGDARAAAPLRKISRSDASSSVRETARNVLAKNRW